MVGELIEEPAGEALSAAISRLLLRPLDISGARIVRTPADLAGVAMGSASSYHPGWVYHGLVVGPLREYAPLWAGVDDRDCVQWTQGDGSHRRLAAQRHRRLLSTRRRAAYYPRRICLP